MATNFEKVAQFMRTFGQNVNTTPAFPEEAVVGLRIDLQVEELQEFIDACNNDDIVAAADGLTDLLYVIYGAGHAFGMISISASKKCIGATSLSSVWMGSRSSARMARLSRARTIRRRI